MVNDDPSFLKTRIKKLEQLLAAKNGIFVTKEVAKVEFKEIPMIKDSQITRMEKAYENVTKEINRHEEAMGLFFDGVRTEVRNLQDSIHTFKATPAGVSPARRIDTTRHKDAPLHTDALPAGGLTGPEQKVLDALTWCESIGQMNPPNELIAFLSGYRHCRSTGYTNPRGYLKGKGLVVYSGSGVSLTPEGRANVNVKSTPLTTQELHSIVLNKLDGPEKKLLIPLLREYPRPISNIDLCTEAGYMHERSTGYTNPRGRLKTFGLVEYGQGSVVASNMLFI